MTMDVVDLRNFYGTRLGIVARRLINRGIRAHWPDAQGQRVLGVGYCTPYLGLFREDALRGEAAGSTCLYCLFLLFHDLHDLRHLCGEIGELSRDLLQAIGVDLHTRRGRRFALLFGHAAGDQLLRSVATRLGPVLTDDEYAARLGGDEFAVVVKDANDPAKMAKLAQSIIDTLSQPYEVDQYTLYIGASIGTAIGPRDGRTVETLIRSADLALYRSKDEGGGVFHCYEPQLHVHAEERRVIEIALRKALERNEFEVHYQPVVNAQSGTIESFEALLRWTNPELGTVSPAKFIPIAEDARLIGPIGEWVLRTACKEAAKWPATVRVAVNVSAEQLHDNSFASTVVSALAQAGFFLSSST